MFSKKAQSEIITTVLIILLVLAAVVIVWQVVQNTVTKGGEAVTAGASCIGIGLTIDSVIADDSENNVTVRYSRGADSLGSMDSVRMIVTDSSGTTLNSTDSTQVASSLEQKTISVTAAIVSGSTYTVKLAPKLGGTQCDVVVTDNKITGVA